MRRLDRAADNGADAMPALNEARQHSAAEDAGGADDRDLHDRHRPPETSSTVPEM